MKNIITSMDTHPILNDEKRSNTRLLAHMIVFSEEHGNIVARIAFCGTPMIYTVILGKIPIELSNFSFGCGHAFNPFEKEIKNLGAKHVSSNNLTQEQEKISFGLNKKYR